MMHIRSKGHSTGGAVASEVKAKAKLQSVARLLPANSSPRPLLALRRHFACFESAAADLFGVKLFDCQPLLGKIAE